jgi:hypothetical protein
MVGVPWALRRPPVGGGRPILDKAPSIICNRAELGNNILSEFFLMGLFLQPI